MLQRVVRLLCDVVPAKNFVVVSAQHQILPELPAEITITQDLHPERGPLEGLAAGLAVVDPALDAVYVTSCDVPLLAPRFVSRMFELLDGHAIVVPRDGAFHHPLAAVYRPGVLPTVRNLLENNRLRPRFLFDEVDTREVDVEELRRVDPGLHTLRNLNTPEDYQTALQEAGFSGENHGDHFPNRHGGIERK